MENRKVILVSNKQLNEVLNFYELIGFNIKYIKQVNNKEHELIIDNNLDTNNDFFYKIFSLEERYLNILLEKDKVISKYKFNKKYSYLTLFLLLVGTIFINLIFFGLIFFLIGIVLIIISCIYSICYFIRIVKNNKAEQINKKLNIEQLAILSELKKIHKDILK